MIYLEMSKKIKKNYERTTFFDKIEQILIKILKKSAYISKYVW